MLTSLYSMPSSRKTSRTSLHPNLWIYGLSGAWPKHLMNGAVGQGMAMRASLEARRPSQAPQSVGIGGCKTTNKHVRRKGSAGTALQLIFYCGSSPKMQIDNTVNEIVCQSSNSASLIGSQERVAARLCVVSSACIDHCIYPRFQQHVFKNEGGCI
jgi:hypothetical protein